MKAYSQKQSQVPQLPEVGLLAGVEAPGEVAALLVGDLGWVDHGVDCVHLRQHAEGPPPLLSTVAQGVDPLPPLHPQGGLHQDAPLPSQGILAFPFIETFGVSGCYLDKGRPRPVVKSSGALPVDQTHRPKFSTRPELGVFRLPFPDSIRVNPDT